MSQGLEDDEHGIDLAQIATRIAAVQDSTYPDAENLTKHENLNIRIRKEGYRRHNFVGLNAFLVEIVDQFDDATAILLHVDGDTITERLLQCAPPYGGSHVIYTGPCVITGILARCVLPMFPRVLHSLSSLSYDGSEIVRDGDSWVANPPFVD